MIELYDIWAVIGIATAAASIGFAVGIIFACSHRQLRKHSPNHVSQNDVCLSLINNEWN